MIVCSASALRTFAISIFRLFLFFAAGLWPILSQADTNTTATPLKITVFSPDQSVELLCAWDLQVTVQNIADKKVTLTSLQWVLPPQLRATRGKPSTPDWTSSILSADESLDPGQIRSYNFSMPSTWDSGSFWLTNPTILSWHYKELPITVTGAFTTSGTNGISGSVAETIKVKWQTPFRTMVIGGILGALLAMLFYYCYLRLSVVAKFFADRKERAQNSDVRDPADDVTAGLKAALGATAHEHFSVAWRQMLTASITVIIVLLLLASGNNTFLPISISVSDFAGAAFLGLVAHKIGKVTFDAVFGDKPLPSTTQPQVAPPVLSAGPWDPATGQVKLTWGEQKEPKPVSYSIRLLQTPAQLPKDAKLLKQCKPGDKMEFLTAEGLTKAGDKATYILAVEQADARELVSKPVTVERTA